MSNGNPNRIETQFNLYDELGKFIGKVWAYNNEDAINRNFRAVSAVAASNPKFTQIVRNGTWS